jgi:hypothetical protein
MRMKVSTRLLVAAGLAASAGLAVVAPAAIAGAAVKPPVTVTCSNLFGTSTQQLQSGCVGTAKSKVTPFGVSVPNGTDTGSTISWTNKDSTIISFSFTTTTNTCPTYLGYAATFEELETSTVTGGNSKLTTGLPFSSKACVYVDGSQILVTDAGASYTL